MKFKVKIHEVTQLKQPSDFNSKDVKTRFNKELQKYYASNDDGITWDEVSLKTAIKLGY